MGGHLAGGLAVRADGLQLGAESVATLTFSNQCTQRLGNPASASPSDDVHPRLSGVTLTQEVDIQ